jgi:hypothetical protein
MCYSEPLQLILPITIGVVGLTANICIYSEGIKRLARKGMLAVSLVLIGLCTFLGAVWSSGDWMWMVPIMLGSHLLPPIRLFFLIKEVRRTPKKSKRFIAYLCIVLLASIPALFTLLFIPFQLCAFFIH